MKRVFKVTLRMKDGSKDVFNVRANDDIEARKLAVSDLQKSFELEEAKFPGVDFAEIEWVCDIHAG
jgi:hypothetical protein